MKPIIIHDLVWESTGKEGVGQLLNVYVTENLGILYYDAEFLMQARILTLRTYERRGKLKNACSPFLVEFLSFLTQVRLRCT